MCTGSAREGGLVWRGCSAECDAEDGAAGALADGNANPGDKVHQQLDYLKDSYIYVTPANT